MDILAPLPNVSAKEAHDTPDPQIARIYGHIPYVEADGTWQLLVTGPL